MKNLVVLFGPPMAGKTTMLKAFVASRGLRMFQFDPLKGADPDLVAAGLPKHGRPGEVVERGQRAYDEGTQIGVATIWGPFWNRNAWEPLLSKADGLVLVLDPQIAREKPNAEYLERAQQMSLSAACVAWTKQDLPTAVPLVDLEAALRDSHVTSNWRVFRTRHDEPEALTGPLNYIFDALTNDPT